MLKNDKAQRSVCRAQPRFGLVEIGLWSDEGGRLLVVPSLAMRTEVIRQRGPWRNIERVEFTTLEWVDWFNHRRLFQPIGDLPPAEFEAAYYQQLEESAMAA